MHTTTFGTETRAYFPVTLQPVFVGDEAAKAGEYHAVVREDTGDVLGIHRGTYRLVPNREVFEPFEEAILQSGVPIEGLEVHEGLAYRGRTVVREYIFPHVALEPQIGDVVEFKLLVVNSYDATNAFRAVMAGRRRLCLNGLVGEERKAHVYARHTSGFSSERAIDGIQRAMDRYFALDGEWKRWAAQGITREAAREVFEAMPEANPRRLIMGWLFTHHEGKGALIRRLVAPDATERRTWHTLAHCLRGNRLWAVVEIVDEQETRPERYIACYLLDYDKSCGGWGYKNMDESLHPCYYDCPLGYLAMAPIACEAWREEVRAYHARLRRPFEVGQKVALVGSRLPWVRIISLRPLRGEHGGVIYRLPRALLGEVIREATA